VKTQKKIKRKKQPGQAPLIVDKYARPASPQEAVTSKHRQGSIELKEVDTTEGRNLAEAGPS
jgi:hypothetical protein